MSRVRPTDSDPTLGDLFAEYVAKNPDRVAIEADGTKVSYAQLDRDAVARAHWLLGLGVRPGFRVGICLERSPQLIAIMVAIARLGGAYVPLDPNYPADRLRLMAADAELDWIISESRLNRRVREIGIEVWWLPPVGAPQSTSRHLPRQFAAHPDSVLYVMFTSGSTGKPKGAAVSQRAVVRLTRNIRYANVGSEDAFLLASPLSFDASTFEIWGALSNGSRLVIPPVGALSLAELARVIRDGAVTTLFLTTALFEQIAHRHAEDLRGLRQLLTGGEVIPVPPVRRMLTTLPHVRLIAAYGPTENTTFSSCHTVTGSDLERGYIPLGSPIATDRAYVVDDAGNLAPVGSPGELYVGGDGLALGYVRQPALTAERFIADPFSGRTGARLYRTGDRVREEPDGTYEFLGRRDHQVKIRGFRIEPDEIAATLRSDPMVRDAVVIVRDDGTGPRGRQLVAFMVPDVDAGRDQSKVRSRLTERVPEYMIPAEFVFVDEFPLTSTGKIDREALARHRTPQRETDRAAVGPTEELVMSVWRRIFNREDLSVSDDFSMLGGSSLDALALVSELRDLTSIELSLRSVFVHSTIRELSAEIDRSRGTFQERRLEVSPIPRVPRDGLLPLSWAQERVWFVHQLSPASLAYSFHATMSFDGPLDVDVLAQCLRRIVERHEILRTTFEEGRDGVPRMVVHERLDPFPFDIVSQPLGPSGQQHANLDPMLQAAVRTPFALDRLPLVRWKLYRLDARTHILLHSEHHIIHDGWSFNLLLSELLELYRAAALNEEPQLPDLPIQFADFAAWERCWTRSSEAAKQLEYWKRALAGAPSSIHLPVHSSARAAEEFCGAALRSWLPRELSQRIKTFARDENVSEFAVLLSAFALVLHGYGGDTDLCVGVGVANRRRRELHAVMGMLINTIVLRLRVDPAQSLRQLVHDTWRVALEGYTHQECPFNEVVRELRPRRASGRNPLFQVMFSMHDAPLRNMTIPDVTLELREGLSNGSAKFDLNVIAIPPLESRGTLVRQNSGMMAINWEYSTDVFDEADIRAMADQYTMVLQRIVSAPAAPCDPLPCHSAEVGDCPTRPAAAAPGYVTHFESRMATHHDGEM